MRWLGVTCAALIGNLTAMPGQVLTSDDSADVAHALVTYAVAHPIGAGGSHGAMTGLAIDSVASRWDALLTRALRQVAPALWIDVSSIAARTQPHLRVRTVTPHGDSLVIETLWAWCFPSGGGESGWPVTYVLDRHLTQWRVTSAQVSAVLHGRQCSYDGGSGR